MSDEMIIRHCSPTLAGLKTGNLFSHSYADKKELFLSVRSLNRRLVPKGVRVIPLKMSANRVLLYLEREDIVNQPYYMEGEKFDPSDKEGLWLTAAFAKVRNIKVGDDFTISYNGITFTRKVKGLIESPEYGYRQAEGDADIYIENIAFVYMSYDAFPIRDYVEHLIAQGKITAKKVVEESDLLDEQIEVLSENGMSIEDITQDMLLDRVEQMDDEKLAKLMPYTQMIVTTTDGKALEHEDEISEALNGEYAAMVDEHSIPGIERLNSELSQHESFSWVFVIIFVGIAILVIATAMSRMVEKQRTQIGTLNALGMKPYKVVFHYTESGYGGNFERS